ncbi:MAG: lysophospholipid acyltransferase family protein [Deltaproteobacteria bacterium]|nr:lysophospholipid acyltransferase family protein [Deltaproteobacteria bacterium]MBW2018258.1 lysophospholipid acyltransferase family protein [Deltaproteobacteria bacterium]MBW2130687.1 lysophospholipid acyltransferase family protein [Deltaproteobacteria bacterium]MBW2305171.1 lysophospholipid acyltransferase family protein [Deltaproteobacteria bacterium]
MRRHLLDHPVSYYAIFFSTRYLPIGLCRFLGKIAALSIYALSRKDRLGLSRNLALALDRSPADPLVRKTVRRIFLNYGRYLVDFFLIPQQPPHRIRAFFHRLTGEHILQEALGKGRGAILVSAHVGNWEFGGTMIGLAGYPFAVVALAHNTSATNALVNRLRKGKGIKVIEMDHSPLSALQVLGHLRRNGVVAMIGDRDLIGRGRPVRFFGRRVRFPVGPVLAAMKSGAALIPAFVLMGPDGRYSGFLEPPIPLAGEEESEDPVGENLERLARVFERVIRAHPDQWYCPDPIFKEGTPP